MTRSAHDTFSGTLRPNDPRRFLVEAMLGAMTADGKVHEGELASIKRHLEEHDFFAQLTERHHEVLLGIARDALSFAKDSVARIPAIAKGLPSRLHKITALSMACEVVVADTLIADTEVRYLKLLRRALRLSSPEFEEMFAAAKEHRCAADLEARAAQLRALVPTIVELFALRSLAIPCLTPEHRTQILELVSAIPDLQLRDRQLMTLLDRAYSRMHFSLDIAAEVGKVAALMPSLSDRYWAVVYLMCADIEGAAHWRMNPFLSLVQRTFGIDPPDLDLAPADAAAFGSLLPRPTS